MPTTVILGEDELTPELVVRVARRGDPVTLSPAALSRLAAERAGLEAAVAGGAAAYGVTTGLGARVSVPVSPGDQAEVSARTLRGRADAVGPPLPSETVRAALAVRANQMGGGGSGVQPAIPVLLAAMINGGVVPEVPSFGSIGASDLCQLAHAGLVVMGEGWAEVGGHRLDGAAALAAAGLSPVVLGPKDGLALCSSNALSAGAAALALADIEAVLGHAYAVAALSFEGFRANTGPMQPAVLAAHGAPGEERAGRRLLEQLGGGGLDHPGQARRLQDPLSWRCVAQVHGALEAAVAFARPAVKAELNGASDNPLVLAGPDGAVELVSTGNFQPSTLALGLDTLALALHQVVALSAARTTRLLASDLTGLPANLSPRGSSRSGFAPLVKVTQALLSRIRRLASPTYDDPRPGAADVEDNSTGAPLGAERLDQMVDLSRLVLAAEALVAAQAVELAAPTVVAPAPAALLAAIRERIPALDEDRPCGPDVEAVARLLPPAG
jgi:histidine ammonia-lyase